MIRGNHVLYDCRNGCIKNVHRSHLTRFVVPSEITIRIAEELQKKYSNVYNKNKQREKNVFT
jgi:hypothetical protein